MTKNDHLMTRARRLDPVARDAFAGIATSREGRQLLNAILATETPADARTAAAPRPHTIRRGRPRLGLAAGLASLLVVAVIVASLDAQPDRESADPSVARGPLANAALVADRDDRVVVGAGEYIYLHLEGHGTGTIDVDGEWVTARIPTEIEAWVGPDHGGRLITRTGQPEFLSDADRAAWEAAGRPTFSEVGTEDRDFEAGELFPEVDLDSYPTDPDALYAALLDDSRASRSSEQERHEYVFTLASDLLFRFPEASPDLRSALFEVLGKVPGTEVEDDVRDPAGRRSAVVSLTVGEGERVLRRHELFFDAGTAQVTAFQEVVIDENGQESLRSNSVLVRSGVVGSKRSRP